MKVGVKNFALAVALIFLNCGFEVANGADSVLETELSQIYDRLNNDLRETTDALDSAQRESLLLRVRNHKVAALKHLSRYDQQNIGFCFGRAMASQLIARKMGVAKASLRKMLIIGDLRSGEEPEWRFHMTTLVKGKEDGKFYVIDPIMRPPFATATSLPVEEWISVVRGRWDKNNKARVYLTGPDTIIPDMRIVSTAKEFDTGDNVVELSFDPTTKAGFTTESFGSQRVSLVDLLAQEKYFTMKTERDARDAFAFQEFDMVVKRPAGETSVHLVFNNYFTDLLRDLNRAELPPEEEAPEVTRFGLESFFVSFEAPALQLDDHNLYGFGAGIGN